MYAGDGPIQFSPKRYVLSYIAIESIVTDHRQFIDSLNGLITAETVPQLFKRLAEPEDVAGMIVFLLSDDSKFATKGVFSIDGGYIA